MSTSHSSARLSRSKAIHDLLAKLGSMLFALLNEAQLLRKLDSVSGTGDLLALCGRNITSSRLGVSIVALRNLLARLLKHPVILIIVVVPALVHQVLENLPHIVVVRSLLEFEVPTVLQVSVEFFRHAARQRLDGCRDLLIFDSIILVILVFALKTLPRQRSLQEVDEDETDGLEVVTPTLLDAKMCIDTCIARRTRQRLVVLVGNVLTSLGIAIALRQAEVDDVNDVLLLPVANEEVVGLHVAMNKMVVVQELEALDHLVCNHKSGLDREFALAKVECVFETGA